MILGIIQARMGSSRLPGKVLMEVGHCSLLQIMLDRLSSSINLDRLLVATTDRVEDEKIFKAAKELSVSVSKGSENDVLDRFYKAACPFKPEHIVRFTADCPLLDAQLVDKVIDLALSSNSDYCSNTLKPKFPDGQDVEVVKFSALEKAWEEATLPSDREHVTPYIWRNSTYFDFQTFVSTSFEEDEDYSQVRMTVDEKEDFELIKTLVEERGRIATWKEYADHILNNDLKKMNSRFLRNEGYKEPIKKDQE